MRLYWNTLSFMLANYLCRYGNLPYNFLKLLPYEYESLKDAMQRLIRAGLVGVIKAKNLKSLYLTAKGSEAIKETYEKHGCDYWGRHPVAYYPPKLERINQLHVAELLFDLAFPYDLTYHDSRDMKAEMERKEPRSSDSIKYSRFAGIWLPESFGWVVYHFGRKNIRVNPQGEMRARFLAQELHRGNLLGNDTHFLILGDDTNTLLSILRYSDWYWNKSESQRKHLKNPNYHLEFGEYSADYTYFLPIAKTSVKLLELMQDKGFDENMEQVHKLYRQGNCCFCGILDCKIKHLLWLHAHINLVESDALLIVCYDWQLAIVQEYLLDLTDRKAVWIQTISTDTVYDWFRGKDVLFPAFAPEQLTQEVRCPDV